jgi:hypothetical protein
MGHAFRFVAHIPFNEARIIFEQDPGRIFSYLGDQDLQQTVIEADYEDNDRVRYFVSNHAWAHRCRAYGPKLRIHIGLAAAGDTVTLVRGYVTFRSLVVWISSTVAGIANLSLIVFFAILDFQYWWCLWIPLMIILILSATLPFSKPMYRVYKNVKDNLHAAPFGEIRKYPKKAYFE